MQQPFLFPQPFRRDGERTKSVSRKEGEPNLTRTRRELVMRCVSICLEVPLRSIARPGRGQARAVLARHISMYLLHVVFSLPPTMIGRLFRKDRTTVAHAFQRIEERREAATFDAFLHALENAANELDIAFRIRTNQELSGGTNSWIPHRQRNSWKG